MAHHGLQAAVVWTGWVAVGIAAIEVLLLTAALVGKLWSRRFVNLESDAQFFAGMGSPFLFLALLVLVVLAAIGWATRAPGDPARGYFRQMTLLGVGALLLSGAGVFFSTRILGGGVLPH